MISWCNLNSQWARIKIVGFVGAVSAIFCFSKKSYYQQTRPSTSCEIQIYQSVVDDMKQLNSITPMKTLFCHRYLPYILYPNLSFPTFWNGAIRSQAVALGRDPQVFLASAIDPPPLAAVETAMEQLVGIHAVAPGLGMAGHGWAWLGMAGQCSKNAASFRWPGQWCLYPI